MVGCRVISKAAFDLPRFKELLPQINKYSVAAATAVLAAFNLQINRRRRRPTHSRTSIILPRGQAHLLPNHPRNSEMDRDGLVNIPPEFVPWWYDAKPCKGMPVKEMNAVNFLGKSVIWLPDVELKSFDTYKYRTPGKPERLGAYAPWIQPKVELVAAREHANANQWVQCVNPPTDKMFFFPRDDLVLPVPLAQENGGNSKRKRADIVDNAQRKHGEVPRREKLTIGVLRDLMEKDGGVYSKMKAVKALYACYGDSELSLEYLRSDDSSQHRSVPPINVVNETKLANNQGAAKQKSPIGSWMVPGRTGEGADSASALRSAVAAAARGFPPPPRRSAATGGGASAANTTFKVGDRIRARWQGLGIYYPGTIMAVSEIPIELYHIRYDDQMEEHNVEKDFIQLLNPTPRTPPAGGGTQQASSRPSSRSWRGWGGR